MRAVDFGFNYLSIVKALYLINYVRAKIENFRAQTLTDNRLSRKNYQLSLRYALFVNSIRYIRVRSLRKKVGGVLHKMGHFAKRGQFHVESHCLS